ncbi:FecR family protein [Congregibacter sp.]|uniref:FecR family protein n=1 Tax=Congregibacter sp. TaxID=2744308 RepID=UPI003F6C81CD
MNDQGPKQADMNEEQIASLLQSVGERPKPDPAAMARARLEVREAWRESVQDSFSQRSPWRYVAAAASVVLALGFAFMLSQQFPSEQSLPLAQLVPGHGPVEYRANSDESETAWHLTQEEAEFAVGDSVRTTEKSYGALTLADGAQLRMDRDTQLNFMADGELFLQRGAVYVEAPGESTVTIYSDRGVARDIGTRFEVRLVDQGWRIQVREGKVIVEDEVAGSAVADTGVRLLAVNQGFAREPVSSSDDSWSWTHAAQLAMTIEGQTLSAYVDWWSRETGLTVQFQNPIDSAIAGQTLLHGSLDGLSMEEGFKAVTAGAGFQMVDQTPDEIILSR